IVRERIREDVLQWRGPAVPALHIFIDNQDSGDLTMRTYHSLLIALLVAAGLASCDRFQQEETEEAGGRDARIVCVSKQLNEIIFALGAGDRLVGVDLSSTYPPEAAKLPTVGYHRLLSAEGITSLNPTVVFHDGNIAPAAVMTQLEQVGVPVKEFPEAHTID